MLNKILSNLSFKLITYFSKCSTASSSSAMKTSLQWSNPSALNPHSSSVISHYDQHHYCMCDCMRHLQPHQPPQRLFKQQHLYHFRLASSPQHCSTSRRSTHDWKRQMQHNIERRKIIPRLVYFHNPWNYLQTKLNLLKLKFFWDRNFNQNEFIRGSKQAAVVLTNIIREQNSKKIGKFTTPNGFQQISRDMMLSRKDQRLKIVRFESEHLRRAIPMKVATQKTYGRKYCFIDMLFVGLRNTKDFDSVEEAVEINRVLNTLDSQANASSEVLDVPHRIIFAEIFIRFRKDYSAAEEQHHNGNENKMLRYRRKQTGDADWSVSFYKILTFDILSFDPKK